MLPIPKSVDQGEGLSEIQAEPFRQLTPTRAQLSDLPKQVRLSKSKGRLPSVEGYKLVIGSTRIEVIAERDIGWNYGLQTLRQIAQASEVYLPLITIGDHPDFHRRGIMLDVSRNKVPKLKTLFYLIDLFASWKINELQLYIEHSFKFEGHETVWKDASPLTREDIHKLDTYCHDRFIELVPNLNCFGHMTKWLVHEPYNPLAEQPDGGDTDLGYRKEPQGLCPIDPGSIALAEDIIEQMVSCFRSDQVNVGCDETIDLGYGRSKRAVEEQGRGVVYLDYLKKVHAICSRHGKRMQFWADILLKYPELMNETPANGIALNWGYEAIHPFEKETEILGSSGLAFYVCPGTSSWNSIGGRTKNMLGNIRKATDTGKQHGALGVMTTDWGDNGHLQPLVSSFPGFIYGAAKAWNADGNINLAAALDAYLFESHGWGKVLLELGSLDEPVDIYIHNQSALFKILHEDASQVRGIEGLQSDKLKQSLASAQQIAGALKELTEAHPSHSILMEECAWVSQMLIHACKRGLSILEDNEGESLSEAAIHLRAQHETLWHLRNRPGGYLQTRGFFDRLIES